MKIKKHILFYNLISIVIVIISILYKNQFNVITWLLITETFLTLSIIKKSKSLLSVGTIFIIFTLLFHCGQAMITTFDINDPYYNRSIMAESIGYEFVNAEIYVLLSVIFFGNGYWYSNNKKKNNIKITSDISQEDIMLKQIRNVAVIILVFSLIPLIYIDLLKVITLKTEGYLKTYEVYRNGVGKYLNLIGIFARPAISLLMLSYKNNSHKSKLILILSSIYFSIMMLSGDRGTNIIYILVNIFLYYKIIKKINIKIVPVYILIGYIFLGFISAISIFRYSEWSINSFIDVFNLRSSNGIIYSCLREFGGTMRTLVYTMRFIPEYSSYNYGLTYVISLLNILPKLPVSFVNYFINCFGYTNAFPTEFQDSLGGSYLGELYYNFGWIGVLGTSIIGYFIGRIDSIFERTIKDKNWIDVAIIIGFIPNIILWVRDFFSGVLFVGFWIMILFKLLSKKSSYKHIAKKENEVKI